MLSDLEVGQFNAFGYVVLKRCLNSDEVKLLQDAHERVMAESPENSYFGNNGTKTCAPFLQENAPFWFLIEHPQIMEAMRDIWGTECLYTAGSDMWSNCDDTPWHSDGDPGRHNKTLKVAIYLDEQNADTGALNVIPGSHHPEFAAAIFQACGRWEQGARPRLKLERDKVPGATALSTTPGDVVLWDNRIWHSAWKRKDGQPRRTMFIAYAPDPQNDLLAIRDLRMTTQAALNDRQPYIYSQAMMAAGGSAREKMAARLAALGVENVIEP